MLRVPESNEGIMSAMQKRAMSKQHMQLAHRVLTGRSERPHSPFLLGQHTEV